VSGAAPDWRSHQERSTPFMVRLIVWLARNLPRALVRPLLYPIVAYFMLTSPAARKASADYLRRALGHAARWRDQWRHLFAFASCTLDRIFILSKRYHDLDVSVDRPEEVRAAVARGKGCLLFVAHFGSAESLRLIAHDQRQLPLSILLDRQHGRMLMQLLEAGRMVGIMVDRALATDRSVEVDILGGRARLPVGPWQLAHALQVPVVLGFGVYHGGNRYTAHFELFCESLRLPREDREAAIAGHAQRYARRLEHHALQAPYNWFNFFDYWIHECGRCLSAPTR
jgi:predicted LPLAT superfamily acyltransferase